MKSNKKQKKIEPYIPIPYRSTNKLVEIYERIFVDAINNIAIIKNCNYIDKKKNFHRYYPLQIKWVKENQYFTKEESLELNKDIIIGKEKELFAKKLNKSLINSLTSLTDDLCVENYSFFEHDGKKYLACSWEYDEETFESFIVVEVEKEDSDIISSQANYDNYLKNYLNNNKIPLVYVKHENFDYLIKDKLSEIHLKRLLTYLNN